MPRSHPRTLYTTGYQGYEVADFVAHLKSHRVQTLLDVRERPASRKKGFSKSPLRETLEENGIRYVHLRELGSPKDLRVNYHDRGDYQTFHQEYARYLATQPEALDEAESWARTSTVCLMCLERDPNQCHRTVVARQIERKNPSQIRLQHI